MFGLVFKLLLQIIEVNRAALMDENTNLNISFSEFSNLKEDLIGNATGWGSRGQLQRRQRVSICPVCVF